MLAPIPVAQAQPIAIPVAATQRVPRVLTPNPAMPVRPPMPMNMPAAIAVARGETVPSVPISANGTPTSRVSPISKGLDAISMAQSIQGITPAQDPAGQFVVGLINGAATSQAKRKQDDMNAGIAEQLAKYPDLQKYVANGWMDPSKALETADARDKDTAAQTQATDRKAKIIDYLTQAGDTDLAQQFEAGAIDEAGLQKAIAEKDQPKDAWQPMSPEQAAAVGVKDPTGYMINPKTNDIKQVPGVVPPGTLATNPDIPLVEMGANGLPSPDMQSTYLAQFDPERARLLQSIVDYKQDPNRIASLKGGDRQKLIEQAQGLDPSYDATQFPVRNKMRLNVTSGRDSLSLNSANLVIQHLQQLADAHAKLGNQNGPMGMVNGPVNAFKTGVMHDADFKTFDNAAEAVASEAAKVFKGSGATDVQTQEEWRKQFRSDMTPDELQAVIKSTMGLLKARVDTIYGQYSDAMGKPADFRFLHPETVKALTDLGFKPEEIDPAMSDGGADAGLPTQDVPRITSKSDYDALPDGAPYYDSKGNYAVKGQK